MKTFIPQHVVLLDSDGNEVDRFRTDRMNYEAFTWLYAAAEREHGTLTHRLEQIIETREHHGS